MLSKQKERLQLNLQKLGYQVTFDRNGCHHVKGLKYYELCETVKEVELLYKKIKAEKQELNQFVSKTKKNIQRELAFMGFNVHFDISKGKHSVFTPDATFMKQFSTLAEIKDWMKQEKLRYSRDLINLGKVLEKSESCF